MLDWFQFNSANSSNVMNLIQNQENTYKAYPWTDGNFILLTAQRWDGEVMTLQVAVAYLGAQGTPPPKPAGLNLYFHAVFKKN